MRLDVTVVFFDTHGQRTELRIENVQSIDLSAGKFVVDAANTDDLLNVRYVDKEFRMHTLSWRARSIISTEQRFVEEE